MNERLREFIESLSNEDPERAEKIRAALRGNTKPDVQGIKAAPGVPLEMIPRTENLPDPNCRHHWLIESPSGATSWGVCKNCSGTRTFSSASVPRKKLSNR